MACSSRLLPWLMSPLVALAGCTTPVPADHFSCDAGGTINCDAVSRGGAGDAVLSSDGEVGAADVAAGDGVSKGKPCGATAECEDGNPCTKSLCGGDGTCRISPKACADGDPCTVDGCDGATGACYHAPVKEPVACDDGEFCTVDDVCDGSACKGGGPRDCSDGNACTLDRCEAGKCVNPPGDADDDGSPSALCGGDDCNDGDKAIHPGAKERCNGLDDDCDGATDEGLSWSGVPLGQPCSVGKGACKATGTVLCMAENAACNAKPGKPGGWSSSASGNGSWDWDCDGKVEKRHHFTTEQLAKPLGWCTDKYSKGSDWMCHVTTRGANGKCAEVFIANCGDGDACGVTIFKAQCKEGGPYQCSAAGAVGKIKQECR